MRKIGFILCSKTTQPLPSTRIAVLNILPFIHSAGFHTSILFEPEYPSETPNISDIYNAVRDSNCDLVVLQKVRGPSAISLVQRLSAIGIRTIFLVCDRIDQHMAAAADATIVVSDYLRLQYPLELQSRIHVVHDGIENPDFFKKYWNPSSVRLTASLVTSRCLDHLPVISNVPRWLNIRVIGQYQSGLQKIRNIWWNWQNKSRTERITYLRFLINHRITCVPWGQDSVYSELFDADIGIIPISSSSSKYSKDFPPEWMLKSANRLTLKMSVGLPVIATPIPAYEPVIIHGVNGFFARSSRDWDRCLKSLRDPDLRKEMGTSARNSVKSQFSIQEQANLFLQVVKSIELKLDDNIPTK